MTTSSRKAPNAVVPAIVVLASSCWTSAATWAEGAPGKIAHNDAIFVDGQTFEVISGRARGDASAQIKNLNARALGPAAIVFRSGDKLYVAGVPLRLQGGSDAAGQEVYVTADEAPA